MTLGWKGLLITCIIFGFAPRLCLRIISKAWPKGDPTRQAIIADLVMVPAWRRPIYVFEQLENALSDGLPTRWRERQWQRRTTASRTITQMSIQLALSDLVTSQLATANGALRWQDVDFVAIGEDGATMPVEWDSERGSLSFTSSYLDSETGTWVHHVQPHDLGSNLTLLLELKVGSPPESRHSGRIYVLSEEVAQEVGLEAGCVQDFHVSQRWRVRLPAEGPLMRLRSRFNRNRLRFPGRTN
jgi:hypothetical protein